MALVDLQAAAGLVRRSWVEAVPSPGHHARAWRRRVE
jgi:hypothetical protein